MKEPFTKAPFTKERLFKIRYAVLLMALYVILGALLPFANTKRVDDLLAQTQKSDRFYKTGQPSGDRAAVVESSTDALTKRMQIIHQAKERIVLSTFDIRDGTSINDIFSALWEAAERGVKIQILVDGMYGTLHMAGNPLFYAISQSPNVEIRFYNKPSILKPWTINGRMHDKYLLADDEYLILGGRNTFDYFLGEYDLEKLSFDRDVFLYHKKEETIDGGNIPSSDSAIPQVYGYFQEIWDSGYCEPVFTKPPWRLKDEIAACRETLRSHYRNAVKEHPDFTAEADFHSMTIPIQKATLISNPIHPYAKEPLLWAQLVQLMKSAKSRVWIQTPYAVLSKDMYRDMADIDLPDFSMLVNSTAVGDNFMASSDYTLNRSDILKTGVTLYEYFGALSSHGKSILIDGDLSLIGSYNVDMRSTYVNTEVMLVIHGEAFNRELETHILAMKADSLKLTPEGDYVPDHKVTFQSLPPYKKLIFFFSSRLFQLIRYLI